MEHTWNDTDRGTLTSIVIHHHHHVVCLTTGPWHVPKRVLHSVRSSASSFNFQHLLVSWRSSSTCLRLLPRLSVSSIFPSITFLCGNSYARCDHCDYSWGIPRRLIIIYLQRWSKLLAATYLKMIARWEHMQHDADNTRHGLLSTENTEAGPHVTINAADVAGNMCRRCGIAVQLNAAGFYYSFKKGLKIYAYEAYVHTTICIYITFAVRRHAV
jgi:hypothetical protein